jgi:hypothetical protein
MEKRDQCALLVRQPNMDRRIGFIQLFLNDSQ